MPQPNFADRLVASPCSNPSLSLPEALAAYAGLGFRTFEAFTSWTKSALDWTHPVEEYLALAKPHGIRFTSLHLPPVGEDIAAGIERAVQAARFAHRLGVEVVLFKAASRDLYLASGARFLNAIADLKGLTPVLQNHAGTPIHSLEDMLAVFRGIGHPRLKLLFEVGHFHVAGVTWSQAYPQIREHIALVHVKDIAGLGGKPVPFGRGDVDLKGLLAQLRRDQYPGRIVVEMEAPPDDNPTRIRHMGEGRSHLLALDAAIA